MTDAETVAIKGDWDCIEIGFDGAIVWADQLCESDEQFIEEVSHLVDVDEYGRTWYYSVMPDESTLTIINLNL